MRSVLAYTAARIVLFVVALGIVYLAGARGLLALAVAVLASGLVSFVLLSRQRDAVSGVLVSRFRGFRQPHDRAARPGRLSSRLREFGQRIDEGTRAEDRD